MGSLVPSDISKTNNTIEKNLSLHYPERLKMQFKKKLNSHKIQVLKYWLLMCTLLIKIINRSQNLLSTSIHFYIVTEY